MSLSRPVLAAALGVPLFGVVLFNSLPTPANPPLLQDSNASCQANEQANKIQELLKTLPKKSASEKIKAAYDGAIRTHTIGFSSEKP